MKNLRRRDYIHAYYALLKMKKQGLNLRRWTEYKEIESFLLRGIDDQNTIDEIKANELISMSMGKRRGRKPNVM